MITTDDGAVLQALAQALAQGSQPWLCMIISAVGSSPRPVGTLLAVTADSVQTGSLSGGCVEEDLVDRLLAGEFDSRAVQTVEYGVSAEDNMRWGLPCGGRLTLAVQRLDARDTPWITAAQQAIAQRLVLQRDIAIADGNSALTPQTQFNTVAINDTHISHCFGPRLRLLLIGAGAISAALTSLALATDYEVTVIDSRDWAIAQWTGPPVDLVLALPDDAIRAQSADQHTAIVTLSHDPRVDDMALLEALESDAWYVGALGSLRTSEKRRRRLTALGMSDSSLARLHAPVGLDIGSKTPMEIAIAIMAELIQYRRGALRNTSRTLSRPMERRPPSEFDRGRL